ncbi:MAG: esterase/lipase family protein [Acutalibacteraceae bacterium]
MKKSQKILAVLLAVVMALSALPFAAFAQEAPVIDHSCKTDCGGQCGYTPVIIVPGIMQSQVYVQNQEGTGDLMTVDGFPIVEGMDMQFMFDTQSVKQDLKKMIWPILKALLFGQKAKLTDLVCEIADKCFYSHYFNEDGTRVYDAQVDEYWYSVEESKNHPEKSYGYAKGYRTDKDGNTLPTTKYETEYDFIMRQVDLTEYADMAGYDHVYYYAYSSFGDTYSIAERFNEYIQMVKDQTGHDKVSVVFISLGGTIGNTYLADFCNPDDIDRIVFAAAAMDGSYLLSDLMKGNLTLDSKDLYTTILPDLMYLVEQVNGTDMRWVGYLLNVVLRIIPQRFLSGTVTELFQAVIDRVLGKMLYNCPSMWALVPSAEYPEMADRYIKNETLRAKTDRYYNIQKNAAQTLQERTAEGMDIFVVCGYNLPMPSILGCYKYSSDNIIQASSSSAGATIAPYGKTLPTNYKPAIDESYISPEREVDAGTAALPERTWFIRNQSHLTLQSALHDTIHLCIRILADKQITDARVHNGGFAQFNGYRPTKELQNLIDRYEELTQEELSALKPAKASALQTAYENAVDVLESKDWDYDKEQAAEKALYTALYNAKLLSDQKSADSPYKKYSLANDLTKFAKGWSDLTALLFGNRDFIPFI